MFENILIELYKKFWSSKRIFMPRKIALDLASGTESWLLTGPRRSGKSTLLYDIFTLLVNKGSNKTDFIFVNFEDPTLTTFKFENFGEILATYNSLYPDKKPILLLDEIQHITNWEKFVRNLVDNQYRVFVTGSNSGMLSNNSKSLLGGRFIQKNITPCSFFETLYFKGYNIDKVKIMSEPKIKNNFKGFLDYGGFPEVVLSNKKEEILNTYFDLAISDVLKERSDFEEFELKTLIMKIRENIGKEATTNSYTSFFNSINYKIDKNKIYKYFDALEEKYIIVRLNQYRKSVKSRTLGKKTYIIDNGYVFLFDVKQDNGLKLENQIFLELYKRNKEIYYYKNKFECDFIIKEKEKVSEVIQVSHELNDENRKREIGGLLMAMTEFNLGSGLILTSDQEQVIKKGNKKIKVMPAWKWVLEN